VKILLTGASSFTGFWFAGRLAEAGHEVVAALRGSPGGYAGVRAQRAALLGQSAEVVPGCAFGDPAFLDLIAARDFDVLCHHAAEARDYRSADFDVAAAVAANTLNLRRVLAAMRERGLKAVVATGSVFEPDEGCGPAPRRAFSPYGVSKRLTFEVLRYWGDVVGAPVSKFVIANPFGPFEEARFVAHAVETWAKGEAVEVRTPHYLRDNIHVDLLALVYADFVGDAGAGHTARRLGPCGYMETQGAFAQRLGRELGPRLGVEARVVLAEQKAFAEPQVRINTDVIDGAALGWREDKAWDALAEFYRGRGFAAAARPAAGSEPPPLPAAPAVDPARQGVN
jgi:nucleoside-diphosphate-sugar epimerase